AHIHVGDVDGEDFKGSPCIKALVQHQFGDDVGVLQYIGMAGTGTDGGDDALAHASDDGGLARTAHQTVDVGPHGHPGLHLEFDSVLSHGRDQGGFNHLRIDAHLHSFQHFAACQVNGGGPLETD